MTDAELIDTSRSIAVGLETIADRHTLNYQDRVALAVMALSQIVARYLGPVGCVERLRDVADTIEATLLHDIGCDRDKR